MKNIIRLLITLALLTISSAAFSTEYYFCDIGDDSNPGTEEKPMQSYDKAMTLFKKMSAGSSISFCRGGSFEAATSFRLYNTNCSAENVCRVGDYGDTSKERPTIYASNITVFNFQDGGGANQDGGYLLENMILRSRTDNGNGVMLFNDVDDLTMNNLHIEGFNGGVYSAKANTPEAGANKINERIVLKNSVIINNKKMGWLGACTECLIENNVFENNGTNPIFDHNIYLSGSLDAPSNGITIRNNTLYKSSFTDGKCRAVSLVGHGIINRLTIDGNIIKEDAGAVDGNCWGIQIDPGYGKSEESFVGLTITNNKILNVGNTGIACASCENVLIKNNDIIDEGNVLTTGISVPAGKEAALKSKNVIISNNRIALNGNWGIGITMGGVNQFSASGNKISVAESGLNSRCFNLFGGNTDTDVTNNHCMTHTSMSLINFSDTDTNDDVTAHETNEVIEPIFENESEETSVDDGSSLKPISTGVRGAKIQTTNSVEPESEQPSELDVRSSSSTAGGTSSTSASSGSSSTSSRIDESDSLSNPKSSSVNRASTYSPEGGSNTIEKDNSESLNSENFTLNQSAPSESSIRSVTLGDVIDASKEDSNDIEPSTCRAYARERCIMR